MCIWACGSYRFSFVGVISICIDMVERKAEVVGRLKALEEAASLLVAFLQNLNAVQELRFDKQYNLQNNI